ncbi:hypothetical protein M885DRAFT_559147 [Pelagophyceae sp. CCMP2097]|nr:hypothetical protein M885DRAFT_559147 [Pelagophyceae sp. CCMP2097]
MAFTADKMPMEAFRGDPNARALAVRIRVDGKVLEWVLTGRTKADLRGKLVLIGCEFNTDPDELEILKRINDEQLRRLTAGDFDARREPDGNGGSADWDGVWTARARLAALMFFFYAVYYLFQR